MPRGEITGYIDVAQVVLYAFWIFFAGLVFWLRREDRREGYPLENEAAGRLKSPNPILIPTPKAFRLSSGHTTYAPNTNFDYATGVPSAKVEPWPGAPYERTERSFQAPVGPGSWAPRHDEHDQTWDGQNRIVPLRVATHFVVHEAGPNPIGSVVFGADRQPAGTVVDLWVDRGESFVRYYEVELGAGGRRVLMPVNFCRTGPLDDTVKTKALLARQFADIPGTRDPDSVTLLEEEKIMAYFGAGTLYATPARAEPIL
ncbi:photosynthetic reaction center subunit H [Methylobacterium organophilum]|uniref:Reaction center protein H chain n=1 Tax=Methylobacterium organophilum TaxID=410 RepID=A0ABQ4TA67_METOR|nr:photosynthetic reaction center subunit H [Methylobacterium organophilum]GJE28557.1 Reaction center protein H chain [Methylobacterium organophilum]